LRGQFPVAQNAQVRAAQRLELVEQRRERAAAVALDVPKAVERREPADRALLQDDPRSRDPVGLFAIDQVTDDVEGAP